MKCPYCDNTRDHVVDSRSSKEGAAIRRRRECLSCGKRFTTYEYIENFTTVVIKKDRRREPFDRSKLKEGILIAVKKRPIGVNQIENMVDTIEKKIEQLGKGELESLEIGKMVMEELYEIDQIAYIRFASVYRDFKSADEFVNQVSQLTT